MQINSRLKKILVILGLTGIICINYYLYRSEFKPLIDPNDNVFQYALVDDAKNIWKNIFAGKLSPFYLLDSWNERWAEGFALSSSYAHLPQAVISLISYLIPVGSMQIFVVIRTLMLILMPLMFFWAGTILRLPSVLNLILALFSQAIFTDGLYGIDVSSFIWRGWGLSAQLMAVFFLPVAFVYGIDYIRDWSNGLNRSNWIKLTKAVFFNFLVAQAHIGIFYLVFLSYSLYILYLVVLHILEKKSIKTLLIRAGWFIGLTLFSLAYFIVPFFLQSNYRNFSVWDPIWKFDSWGVKQILTWFMNGDLFDFGRLPFLTLVVGLGLFWGFAGKNKLFKFLSLLFVFYFVLFFGRTSLGRLIDFFPGFSEFHLHRIVVMVQFIGIFLGAGLLYSLIAKLDTVFFALMGTPLQNQRLPKKLKTGICVLLFVFSLLLIYFLEKPLVNYSKDNSVWIERANKDYLSDLPSYEKIKSKLNSLPRARVYAGKPGNWGKGFTLGETPLYMALSQDGFPVIGFLPESWSMNSDQEQFFDENDINFYDLYNVEYSLLPKDIKPQKFAKLLLKEGKYNLYQIQTEGWFDFGTSSLVVQSKKTDLLNLTRLWFGSKYFVKDFPKIDLNNGSPDGKRWYIKMSDMNNFINLNDGIKRNIWQANPFTADITTLSRPRLPKPSIGGQALQSSTVNGYSVEVDLKEDCQNCLLVLKQSFHPNWQVKINEAEVEAFPVFPFYIGIPLEKAGNYQIEAVYKPNKLKIILVWLELVVGGYFIIKLLTKKLNKNIVKSS